MTYIYTDLGADSIIRNCHESQITLITDPMVTVDGSRSGVLKPLGGP